MSDIEARLGFTDHGRASKKTKGALSGLRTEAGSPPFNYYPWG